ncbi:hypothetical protein OGR47_10735 [Methylocystis sp. MJC1]|jgi:hypothetical protein|nr:hypothetical protein [Methylocystis sp. MJC1]MBU6527457.1 hypothetical protein [Methylocystis sp. MJC1]UZX10403.1 hypothetical protein OGR47_10735 [Methylocystis sp. MJC1]
MLEIFLPVKTAELTKESREGGKTGAALAMPVDYRPSVSFNNSHGR